MRSEQLYRLSGAAAVIGGVSRIVTAFPWTQDAIKREALYDIIDILLLFGFIGIYLERREKLGYMGFASFVVGVAALSFIGGPDADPFGFSTYQQGAAALVIALLGLSFAWLRAGEKPLWAAGLWFLSAIAGGLLNRLPGPFGEYGYTVAGILFAGGFIAAGATLVNRKN